MRSSRMRTARSLTTSCSIQWGVSAQSPLPRMHTPLDADAPPGCRPPWTEGMTHACENITLPQTSFAGGKNSAQ